MKKIKFKKYKRYQYLCEFCRQRTSDIYYLIPEAYYKIIIQSETGRKVDFDFCEKHFKEFIDKISSLKGEINEKD